MEKKTALLLCISGYLIFVFLFFTEPLQYNPITACLITFVFFLLFFFILTWRQMAKIAEGVLPQNIIELFKRIAKISNRISACLLMFYIGWSSHALWTAAFVGTAESVIWIVLIFGMGVFAIEGAKSSRQKRT